MFRLRIDAYCRSEQGERLVREAAADISLARSRVEVFQGGADRMVADHASGERATNDVLILEVCDGEDAAVEEISRVFERASPNTSIVVAGRINSIPFNERLLEGGVSEYVLLPASPSYLITKLARIFARDEKGLAGKGKVLAFLGAKGGAGTSTFAQNVAWALQERTSRAVTLVDLDMHFGTVALNLNQDTRVGTRDAILRASADQLDPAMMERMYTRDMEGARNLWMLASSPDLEFGGGYAAFQPEVVQYVLDMAAAQASYVVLDLPRAWSPVVAQALTLANEAVVVCDHSIQSLRNADLLFKALNPSKPANTTLRYALNHAGLASLSDLDRKDFQDTLGSVPAAVVPWLPKVFRTASSEGRPLHAVPGSAKAAAPFRALAEMVAGADGAPQASKARTAGFRPRASTPKAVQEGGGTGLLAALLAAVSPRKGKSNPDGEEPKAP